MAEYILHCFAQSGNAYKAALLLELAGADWQALHVDYFNGETRTPAYRAINPMGEVPVLQHGDVLLSQSGVILDYLAERYTQFGPRSPAERREMLRWILFDNHKLTSYTATYRFMRAFVEAPNPDVMAEFRKRSEVAWGVLDSHLRERTFVVGDRLTYVDLSLCGYLFFDDEIGVDWKGYPGIHAWLARIRAQPRWRHPYQLMPGHPRPAAAA